LLDTAHISGIKKEKLLSIVFFLFLAVVLVNRIWLFFTVNINCIDNDQTIMWLGAKHYSQGLFYEPRFYGQDYNTMMEALVAVPFIKLGLPVFYAVPIATHIIFLTPFLFTGIYLFLKKQKEAAIFVLATLLCMPTGYDIMNSIPRGFVTGLFFTSLFVVNLLNPRNYKFMVINVFMAYVGYAVNQNSVLVSAPFLFYLFLVNYKDKKFYIYSLAGLLLALPVDYGLNHFYKVHPEYVFYPANNFFAIEYFVKAVSELDKRFAHISFFIEEQSFLMLAIFVLISYLLFKKNKPFFFAFLVFIAVLLVSFFSRKVSDGIVWPFYSYSRMYLGIPIILYILIIGAFNLKKVIYVLIPITLIFTTYKMVSFKSRLAYHTRDEAAGFVHLNKLNEIFEATDKYRSKCKSLNINDFIIINSVWHDDEINYGGPALFDDFPKTFKPSFERRSWRRIEEKTAVHSDFIIYTADYDFDRIAKQKYKTLEVYRLDDHGLFLIKNNKLNTVAFLKYIRATMEAM
jgi:hypothetical protein